LKKGEEIVGCLAKVSVVGHFWEGDCFGEPVEGECVADGIGVGEEGFIAAVMFERWSDVETFAAMGSECPALGWCFESEDFCTGDGHWCFVEVEDAEDAGVC
jgi:hypothetical protein